MTKSKGIRSDQFQLVLHSIEVLCISTNDAVLVGNETHKRSKLQVAQLGHDGLNLSFHGLLCVSFTAAMLLVCCYLMHHPVPYYIHSPGCHVPRGGGTHGSNVHHDFKHSTSSDASPSTDMSKPTTNWERVGDQYYRKIQLYTSIFDEDLELENYLISGAPYSGALGMRKRLHTSSKHF